jgi:uncharacterized protein YegP (UPF0339 family)
MIDLIIITIASLTVGYLIGWFVQGYVTFQRNLDKKIEADHKLLKPTGYFHLFKDKKGEWRFNILASNFKVIAVSEGYYSKRNAQVGLRSLWDTMNGILKYREKK